MRVLKHYLNSSGRPRASNASNQNPHTSGVAGFLLRLTMFNTMAFAVGIAWRNSTLNQRNVTLQLG